MFIKGNLVKSGITDNDLVIRAGLSRVEKRTGISMTNNSITLKGMRMLKITAAKLSVHNIARFNLNEL